LPFPQTVVVHTVGPTQPPAPLALVHDQPSACVGGLLSSVHSGLQPSPATVLPSSHCSAPATLPSPHLAARQIVPGGHSQPHSSVQPDEQPSPSVVLPSSHVSRPSIS
jgi:hypothetical protein